MSCCLRGVDHLYVNFINKIRYHFKSSNNYLLQFNLKCKYFFIRSRKLTLSKNGIF